VANTLTGIAGNAIPSVQPQPKTAAPMPGPPDWWPWSALPWRSWARCSIRSPESTPSRRWRPNLRLNGRSSSPRWRGPDDARRQLRHLDGWLPGVCRCFAPARPSRSPVTAHGVGPPGCHRVRGRHRGLSQHVHHRRRRHRPGPHVRRRCAHVGAHDRVRGDDHGLGHDCDRARLRSRRGRLPPDEGVGPHAGPKAWPLSPRSRP